jgi:hypothetical protein
MSIALTQIPPIKNLVMARQKFKEVGRRKNGSL